MNVIVATIAQNIMRMLPFVSTLHIRVYFHYVQCNTVTAINIDALYCETIHRSQTIKKDTDYKHVSIQVMNVLIDVVMSMEYAISLGIGSKKVAASAVVSSFYIVAAHDNVDDDNNDVK